MIAAGTGSPICPIACDRHVESALSVLCSENSTKSRRPRGKCIGQREVAGRVVKESYGEKKQQHTFTVSTKAPRPSNPHVPTCPWVVAVVSGTSTANTAGLMPL